MAANEPLISGQITDDNVVHVVPVEPQQQNVTFCAHCGIQTVPSFQFCQQCGKPQQQHVIIVQAQPQPRQRFSDPIPEISNAIERELEGDDPTCLYICAVCSVFIPIIGIVVILIYLLTKPHKISEGTKKRQAFIVLIILTVVGLFWSAWFYGFYI
eukprot:UN12650